MMCNHSYALSGRVLAEQGLRAAGPHDWPKPALTLSSNKFKKIT
jgi:hypothetical protein